MNYLKKTGFNLYQSRHCAYITYSVKTWFLKILSVSESGPTYRCINLYIFKFFPVPATVSTAKDAQSIFGTDIVFSGKNLMLGKTHNIFFLIKPLR